MSRLKRAIKVLLNQPPNTAAAPAVETRVAATDHSTIAHEPTGGGSPSDNVRLLSHGPNASKPNVSEPHTNDTRQLAVSLAALDDVSQIELLAEVLRAKPGMMAEVTQRMPPLTIASVCNPSPFLPFIPKAPPLRDEFQHLTLAGYGLQRLLDDWDFETVVDVGAGLGQHADILLSHGKDVTEIDLGLTKNFSQQRAAARKVIVADINTTEPTEQFDCLWASHVLEHQPNVQNFLSGLRKWVKPGGIIAITVPPLKNEVVSGHLNLFTPGHLLYNLAASGLDCSQATTLAYHYNITVIVENRTFDVPDLTFDAGDVERLLPWLPQGFSDGVDGCSTAFVERAPDPKYVKAA